MQPETPHRRPQVQKYESRITGDETMKAWLIVVCGVVIAAAVGFDAGKTYASIQDEDAADALTRAHATIQANMDHALDSWRTAAEACQAKFNVDTLLIEPRAVAAGPSIPLMH